MKKKNNNTLYIILSIASVACCGASLLFDPSQKAFTMLQSLYILEDIYLTRNIDDTYSIPDQSKNYIKSFRTAINKRKAVE